MSVANDIHRAFALGPSGWTDLARAAGELAIARYRFGVSDIEHFIDNSGNGKACDDRPDDPLVDRVAFAVPRVAARMPWRADCLIQALAAQRWLASAGIASQIRIGARENRRMPLDAHAWLTVGDRVVTGGDVADFSEFTPACDALLK